MVNLDKSRHWICNRYGQEHIDTKKMPTAVYYKTDDRLLQAGDRYWMEA